MATRRLLLVFAHPDDETFVAGGACRRYADAGAKIVLITATRGAAGSCGSPPLCSRAELPARRETELGEAARILGVSEVHLLNYRDKRLGEAPAAAVRLELVTFIRRYRPHVLLTFDPRGMNGHPDHVAISRFAMDAVATAADSRHDGSTRPHHVPRVLWNGPIAPWQVTEPDDLSRLEGADFVIDTSAARHAKATALRAHRTQRVSIDRCFFEKPDVDAILSVEVFRQASGPALATVPTDDLFQGIP